MDIVSKIEEIKKELKRKDLEFMKNAKDLDDKSLYKLLGYLEGLKFTLEVLEKNGL